MHRRIAPAILTGLALLIGLVLWARTPATAALPGPEETPEPPASPVRPQGAVVRIPFPDEETLARLAAWLDVWEVHRREGFLVAWVTAQERRVLEAQGIPVTEDPEATAQVSRPFLRSGGQEGGIPGYACYRTVEETYADLAGLAQAHPELARWVDWGDSYDKVTPGGPEGYDLQALELTNPATDHLDKGILFVLAATHARELATAELVTRFAELLVQGYGQDPEITALLDFNRIVIAPYGNPDGRKWAEQGYLWRKNTDNPAACSFPNYGVDLNRNAEFLWDICGSGCSSGDPCNIVYRGPSPASEPETQAFQSYVRQLFPDQKGPALDDPPLPTTNGVFLSLHSYGGLVIYPWDWTGSPAPNRDALRTLGRKFGFYNRYEVCNTSNCLYAIDGSQTDFAYGELGVAAYTFEVGTTFFQGCDYFEETLLQPNLEALLFAAKVARRPYQLPAGPEVVDVIVEPARIAPGMPVRVQALADDTRFFSNGYYGTEPTQTVQAARFSVDGPDWLGGPTFPLAAADGLFDQGQEAITGWIDTTGWAPGRHTLFLQAQDTDGHWGPPTAVFLWVVSAEGMELETAPSSLHGPPGARLPFTITVTNRTALTDTYRLQVEGSDWPVSGGDGSWSAGPGEAAAIPLQVSVPVTATSTSVGVALLAVESTQEPSRVGFVTVQALADTGDGGTGQGAHRLFLPLVGK